MTVDSPSWILSISYKALQLPLARRKVCLRQFKASFKTLQTLKFAANFKKIAADQDHIISGGSTPLTEFIPLISFHCSLSFFLPVTKTPFSNTFCL